MSATTSGTSKKTIMFLKYTKDVGSSTITTVGYCETAS